MSIIRKYHNHELQANPWHREEERHTKITRHQEDKLSKATSSRPALEWTPSNAQQNVKQLQNSTMGETTNSESSTAALERTAA